MASNLDELIQETKRKAYEDMVQVVLTGSRPLRIGEIMGQLLEADTLITGGDVKAALTSLEARGTVEQVCGNYWRLR